MINNSGHEEKEEAPKTNKYWQTHYVSLGWLICGMCGHHLSRTKYNLYNTSECDSVWVGCE